ncbi:MAG: GNAT family N-acetyltransferase [Armatimonadetes bacterium]|nr:GNAT family N-acetyltransferase [Armatimonadota bacterium]
MSTVKECPAIKVRPFERTDEDYEAFIRVYSAHFPEYPTTVGERRHWDDTRSKKYPFHRDMIELDGAVIGYGVYGQSPWAYHPKKFYFEVYVHPDNGRRGIGTAYLQHVIATLADRRLIGVTAGTREDKIAGVEFLAKHGFTQTMRCPRSHLQLDEFDVSRFEGLRKKVTDQGLRVVTLRELSASDPDWKRKSYELNWEIIQDVPTTDPQEKQEFETYAKQTLGDPNMLFDGWFVALDGDRYVGMTNLWANQTSKEMLFIEMTGTTRSHRRRGIATALKVYAAVYARKYGAKIIETDNEESNPMYQINMRLGFKPQPAWLEFEKTLGTE